MATSEMCEEAGSGKRNDDSRWLHVLLCCARTEQILAQGGERQARQAKGPRQGQASDSSLAQVTSTPVSDLWPALHPHLFHLHLALRGRAGGEEAFSQRQPAR